MSIRFIVILWQKYAYILNICYFVESNLQKIIDKNYSLGRTLSLFKFIIKTLINIFINYIYRINDRTYTRVSVSVYWS